MGKMLEIDEDEKHLLVSALEEMLYSIALEMDNFKGGPMNAERKKLSEKQKQVEDLLFKIDQLP